jgi:hypothetical protein
MACLLQPRSSGLRMGSMWVWQEVWEQVPPRTYLEAMLIPLYVALQ